MDLSIFNTASLFDAATDLFNQLNIQLNSNTSESLPARDVLKDFYREVGIFQEIQNTYFIGIINESIFGEVGLFDERYSYKQALEQSERNYDGLMFFALELSKHPTRTEISDLTRAFNRISQKMPVGLLLKYDNLGEAVISITISERFKYKQNWRQGEKAGKVIILRDIHTINTHAGHIRILKDLVKPVAVTSYSQLHEHWLQVLDVNILNKRFYQELANWFFWAMNIVEFPDDVEKNKEIRNATNLIRLITRVIFIWFIKEKRLVPNNLFRKDYLKKIVVDFMKNRKSENFYQAILQNLFFGTLNQVIEDRNFVKEGSFHENREEYGVKNLFRYSDKFLISKNEIKELFKDIPFLNGGLFDCLDKPDDEGKIIYVDGFSRNSKKQSHVPDYLFFSDEIDVDLNEIYGTRSKRYKVQGLINLLDSYKFTVAENTPVEEEIALDPELLGKVFENLLASYNPETQTTARKQTGSFYTPREIVNYMVDESLVDYLSENIGGKNDLQRLRELLSFDVEDNPYDENETKILIEAIQNCKVLDPACGSGAFPMGILHKMVHILNKLDSSNQLWKELQKTKAIEDTKIAYEINDHDERKLRLDEIDDVFENNSNDYGRKLYLIENCIYGIDIQPIAVQIAKLRFFISLIIDQTKQEGKENFGIRSLPNLETKFVAANTLIGLEKPQLKTGDIFLNDTYIEIKKLSEDLKIIRHKYFNAKRRIEKIKYQANDKDLRSKISEQLVKIGHTTINAHKIASFDPYDQNHFANWFEPEWMFGDDLGGGFDIIIGNPPYIFTRDADFSTYFKDYIAKKYFSLLTSNNVKTKANQSGKINLFALFIMRGLFECKKKGVVSFIVPNNLLRTTTYDLIRKYILENSWVDELVDLGSGVFDNVTASTIIFRLKNEINKSNQRTKIISNITNLAKSEFEESFIEQTQFLKNVSYTFNIYADSMTNTLLSKISNNKNYLGYYCIDIIEGIVAHKQLIHEVDGQNRFPLIEGKTIKKYGLNSVKKFITWDVKNIHRTRPNYLWDSPKKIIIQRISGGNNPLTATLDIDKFKTFASVNNLLLKPEYENDYEFFLALLNSRVLNWYYANCFSNNSELTVNISKTYLEKLPIPSASESDKKTIKTIVDRILSLKRKNIDADTKEHENQIDEIVNRLFDLTEQECKKIELP